MFGKAVTAVCQLSTQLNAVFIRTMDDNRHSTVTLVHNIQFYFKELYRMHGKGLNCKQYFRVGIFGTLGRQISNPE